MDERLGGTAEPEQERLERQPLARKAVQRRQAGNRHRADEEEQPGPRHPSQQPAELLDLPRAGGHHDAARAEEQEPLEHRVIQHVVETRRDADRRDVTAAVRQGHHPCAETEEDDADVLDAVIRQEALEIVLHERIQHAQHRREPSQRDDEHAPREPRHTKAECADAHDSVDAGLDEHAGHQRGNAARRGRMRLRQPDVQRNDARLHAEAEEEEREQPVTHRPSRDIARQQRREREGTGYRCQRQEARDQTAGADVRHHEIQKGGAPVRAILMLGRDERRGGQRHQLPGEEKGDHITSGEHDFDGADEHVEGHADEHGTLAEMPVPDVSDAVERDRNGNHGENHEKPRRQPVHRVTERELRRPMDEKHPVHGRTRHAGRPRPSGRSRPRPPRSRRRQSGAPRWFAPLQPRSGR